MKFIYFCTLSQFFFFPSPFRCCSILLSSSSSSFFSLNQFCIRLFRLMADWLGSIDAHVKSCVKMEMETQSIVNVANVWDAVWGQQSAVNIWIIRKFLFEFANQAVEWQPVEDPLKRKTLTEAMLRHSLLHSQQGAHQLMTSFYSLIRIGDETPSTIKVHKSNARSRLRRHQWHALSSIGTCHSDQKRLITWLDAVHSRDTSEWRPQFR